MLLLEMLLLEMLFLEMLLLRHSIFRHPPSEEQDKLLDPELAQGNFSLWIDFSLKFSGPLLLTRL